MARLPRVVVPGQPHHVTQRGVRRTNIFLDTNDHKVYRSLLAKYAQQHNVKFWAYALMTNHIHLIAIPKETDSLARTLRATHGMYAIYFNQKYELAGHVWQARFYSCVLDGAHVAAAIRYVERNPVRASMVDRAQDYRWSSARAHCAGVTDELLTHDCPPLDAFSDWVQWLSDDDIPDDLDKIRKLTKTGRPWGADSFVAQVEKALDVRLLPKKPGPKPRERRTLSPGLRIRCIE